MASVSPIPMDPNDPRNAQFMAKQGQALGQPPMPIQPPMAPEQPSPEEQQLAQLQAQADQQQIPNLQLGQAQLENLQGTRRALLEQEPQADLSALYGLTDIWTGSNMQKGYNAPQSPESRQAFAAKLQDQISSVQNGLTKDQQQYLADKIKRQLEQNNKKAERDLKAALSKQELLAKEEQRKIDRENKLSDMAWQRENRLADLEFQANLARELARINASGRAGDRADRLADKQDARREKEIEALSKRLDIGSSIPTLTELSDLTSKYTPETLPGVGPGEKWKPDWFKSDEAQHLDQLSFGLTSALLQAQSGKVVSESEVKRKQKELGMSFSSTPQAYMRGLNHARDQLYKTAKQAEAGYSPEVLREFKNRGGVSSEDLKGIQFKTAQPGGEESGWTSSDEDELNALSKARGK